MHSFLSSTAQAQTGCVRAPKVSCGLVLFIYHSGTDRLCACATGKLWACLGLHQSYEINIQGIHLCVYRA